jgi:hypothetical protein
MPAREFLPCIRTIYGSRFGTLKKLGAHILLMLLPQQWAKSAVEIIAR